jgi:two-component system chemotaxis response regulator CheB
MFLPRFSRNLQSVAAALRPMPVIAIGASTGGTIALEAILRCLPEDAPPVVIVQHTLRGFVRPLAVFLDRVSPLHVVEAEEGSVLSPGTAYVAPGDAHLTVVRRGAVLQTALRHTPPVHFHQPSVDVLFQSLATLKHVDLLAVLLTGMGRDGAEGLLTLRQHGAFTIAQDEGSSVIFGMPKEAIALDAACEVASLDDVPRRMLAWIERSPAPERSVRR